MAHSAYADALVPTSSTAHAVLAAGERRACARHRDRAGRCMFVPADASVEVEPPSPLRPAARGRFGGVAGSRAHHLRGGFGFRGTRRRLRQTPLAPGVRVAWSFVASREHRSISERSAGETPAPLMMPGCWGNVRTTREVRTTRDAILLTNNTRHRLCAGARVRA